MLSKSLIYKGFSGEQVGVKMTINEAKIELYGIEMVEFCD